MCDDMTACDPCARRARLARLDAAKARATALRKGPGGKLASKRSRTGNPACSMAMSVVQAARFGKPSPGGMSLSEAHSMLGKCRSQARQRKAAEGARHAGNEARAQHWEKTAARGLTGKERLARARELRAKRAGRMQGVRPPGTIDATYTVSPGPGPKAPAAPAPREQAAAHRATKGPRVLRARALADRAADRAFEANVSGRLHRHGRPGNAAPRMGADEARRRTEVNLGRLDRLESAAARYARDPVGRGTPEAASLARAKRLERAAYRATPGAIREVERSAGMAFTKDVTDRVTAATPGLTPRAYRGMVRRWGDQGRIVPQVLNDPSLREARLYGGVPRLDRVGGLRSAQVAASLALMPDAPRPRPARTPRLERARQRRRRS